MILFNLLFEFKSLIGCQFNKKFTYLPVYEPQYNESSPHYYYVNMNTTNQCE